MLSLTRYSIKALCQTSKSYNELFKRSFVSNMMRQWLMPFFNQVDHSRIKEVGPDRACAEWLLKNGASLKWTTSHKFLKDYNSLPVGKYRQLKIQEVDATDSAIMEIGFPYFEGLEHFDKLVLKNCE